MKKTENTPNGTNEINRKEAIKKMGKYAALTAMGIRATAISGA